MKMKVLLLLLLVMYQWGSAQTNSNYQRYVERYKEIAIEEMKRTGVPASIKLAQGILESAAGTSRLAIKANNHFGIKCGNDWKGETFLQKDDDYDPLTGELTESCFRVFKNVDASFRAHSDFLRDPRKQFRYGNLFTLSPLDYRAWATGLKRAGYATAVDYDTRLIKLIEDYQLFLYDQVGYSDPSNPPVVDNTKPDNTNGTNGAPTPPNVPGDNTKPTRSPVPVTANRGSISTLNDVRIAKAIAGETVLDLSRRTGISVRSIVTYNEILSSESDTLSTGQIVFLQPKRSSYRGKDKYHTVKGNETLVDISNKYGVALKSLLDRNRLRGDEEPAIGSSIKLRGWKVQKAPLLQKDVPVAPVTTTPPITFDSLETPDDKPIEVPKPVKPVVLDTVSRPVVVPPVKKDTVSASNPFGEWSPEASKPLEDDKEVPSVVENETTNTPTADKVAYFYTVKQGDTLYNIAKTFNVSVGQIQQLNKLGTSTSLKTGQVLQIE